MSNPRPLARKEGLIIQTLENETLVYDSATNHAYVLNPITTAVWNACNGQRTVHEITKHLSRETPIAEAVVWYALRQLQDLLHEPAAMPREYVGMTRRQFLTKTGIVAAALTIPVVTKIVAPPPAMAQSATILGCLCNDDSSFCPVQDCNECDAICSDSGGVQDCFIGCN